MPSGSSVPIDGLPPLTPAALRRWAATAGLSALRQSRLLRGVYGGDGAGHSPLDGVAPGLRGSLASSFEWTALPRPAVAQAADGTRKLLFALAGGGVETVLIPGKATPEGGRRYTVCVSSQVGCGMGCDFCATGALGLRRNLTIAEIVEQARAARRLLNDRDRLSNVVFMGMGEPLHNFDAVVGAIEVFRAGWGFGLSNRRITVSTVGLLPQLQRLVVETDVSIAVSLTATGDALRDRLMPVNRAYPVAALVEACRALPVAQRRRIVFEYVLLAGVNDGDDAAADLIDLLRGVRAKVNLIPFNPHPGSSYRRPDDLSVRRFQLRLLASNLIATVRATRGDSVLAACGQLAAAGAAS